MEDLKRKVKILIPEEKHLEIDKIFCDWIASLKVHTIQEKRAEGETNKEKYGNDAKAGKSEDGNEPQEEKITLREQIEELKKQIESFKQKMKMYKESSTSTTDLALSEVKEEIGRVRDGIIRMRLNFSKPDQEFDKDDENAELIKKLDEVKQFLEKLK